MLFLIFARQRGWCVPIGDDCDLLSDVAAADEPNRLIDRIVGRANDFIEVDGVILHSELISHAVRGVAGVTGYQVRIRQGRPPLLALETPSTLSEQVLSDISQQLARVQPALSRMELASVAEIDRSLSGKRPMVVRE